MRIVHEDRECLQAVATLEALGRHTCSIVVRGRAESGETMGVCVAQLEFTQKEGAQDRLRCRGSPTGGRLKTARTRVRRDSNGKAKALSAVCM
jgi:hypothetical protein